MQPPANLPADYPGKPADRGSFVEIVTIALIATTLTTIAWRAFPLWDDGFVWLLSQRGGGHAVYESVGDRPVMARIFQALVDSGHLREATAVIHWLAWFGMGWVTLRLWKLLWPAHRAFALAAACVAVAPVLCRIQTVLLCAFVPSVIGPVVVFLVSLPLLSPGAVRLSKTRIATLWALMVFAVGAVSLISEYALPAVGAVIVLLWGLRPRGQPGARRSLVAIGLLLATAIASYAAYHQLADPTARLSVRPEVQDWGYRAKWWMPRMLSEIWWLTLGGIFERLGAVDVWSSKEAFLGMFGGALGGCFLAWRARREAKNEAVNSLIEAGDGAKLGWLIAAVAVGILPVVAMGVGGRNWAATRYIAPVLPLSAALAVYLPLILLRPRFHSSVALVCGFASGFFLVDEGLLAVHERDRFVALGDQLESQVPASGLNVALVNCKWRYPLPFPQEWELTARLTMNWPQEKRDHFWAFAGMEEVYSQTIQRDGKTVNILDDAFGPHPRLFRADRARSHLLVGPQADASSATRGRGDVALQSEGQPEDVTQILWVTDEPDGKLHVERLPRPPITTPSQR